MALPATLNLLNAGAELADLTSWIIAEGAAEVRQQNPNPQAGANYFYIGLNEARSRLTQVVDIPATEFAAVDAGSVSFVLQYYIHNNGLTDQGRINLYYLDGSSVQLGQFFGTLVGSKNAWFVVDEHQVIPTGTRKIRVELESVRVSGADSDVMFDSISLSIDDLIIDNRISSESAIVISKIPRDDRVSHESLSAITVLVKDVEIYSFHAEVLMTAPPLFPSPNDVPSSVNVTKF